ncbi:MAG: hypothetical protein RL516_1068 [Bacteroidota bacterium]|jgi:hypothetical protein
MLPNNSNLSIIKLSACFNNTSASYKFYWLISIIESIESRNEYQSIVISKKEIFARMISNAWYPIKYFHLSFGVQDKIKFAIDNIAKYENLSVDLNKNELFNAIFNSNNPITINQLNQFDNNVPHWFLSPWFPSEKNKIAIYSKSQNFEENCLYAVHRECIIINNDWIEYILANSSIIKNYCFWKLTLFLQSKNPNVPDIPNKIIKQAIRNSLDKQRKYWNIVFDNQKSIKCIYTKIDLHKEDYVLDHFVPYNFVSHDLIWNLCPVEKKANSKKSDKLPNINLYFDMFFEIQFKGLLIVKECQPNNKLLEDYINVFGNLDIDNDVHFKERYYNLIQPLINIASYNGFELFID